MGKSYWSYVGCLICFLVLQACQQDRTDPSNRIQLRDLSLEEQELVASVNQFSFELFKEIATRNTSQNIFISPFGVNMVLSMTMNGADSLTLQKMRWGLGYDVLEPLEVNKSFNEFTPFLQTVDSKVDFSLVNTVWYNEQLDIQPLFRDMMVAYYHAEVEGMNFNNNKATKTINKWIQKETDGKIKELVRQVQPDEMVYLLSTIHFKGDWTFPFDKEKTRTDNFYLEDGESVSTEMMNTDRAVYRYYQDQRKTLLDIPYGNLQYSMTILLPNEQDSLAGVAQTLTASELNRDLALTDTVSYELRMPKFKVKYSTALTSPLVALGMQEAFAPQAKFPGFSGKQRAWISNVLHTASIEVDEIGTQASAAAGAVIKQQTASSHQTVSLNRPFIFFIRENHSGAILFAGMLTNPTQ